MTKRRATPQEGPILCNRFPLWLNQLLHLLDIPDERPSK